MNCVVCIDSFACTQILLCLMNAVKISLAKKSQEMFNESYLRNLLGHNIIEIYRYYEVSKLTIVLNQ